MTDQEIVRAAGETVMGWTWDDGMYALMFAPAWINAGGERVVGGGWNPLASLSDAGMLIDAMRGKGWWCQINSPFIPREPWRAGFCPEGATGWNGSMDHCADHMTLPGYAITVAALRAGAAALKRMEN